MNTPPRLQWERLQITRYNALDGEAVDRSLAAHEAFGDALAFGRVRLRTRSSSHPST